MPKTCQICSAFIWTDDNTDGVYLINADTNEETAIRSNLLQSVPYKWVNEGADDEELQILYNGIWYVAQSADFDF